jgi:hypothetical protein
MDAAYAREAEAFLVSLNEEFFQHDAGLKDRLEISSIYERHRRLFGRDTVRALLQNRDTPEGRYLAHFAAFGFVDSALRDITERIAAAEARATVDWDGRNVPYRESRILLSNEPDAARRHDLEARIAAATEALNPDSLTRLAAAHDAAADLGFPGYAPMCDDLAGLRLDWLRSATRDLLARTERVYRAALEAHLRRAGIPPPEATTADCAFLCRGHAFDALFPRSDLVPALERTFAGLGINLATQDNVTLDIEERPLKRPRAFCSPIRVPHDVRLAIRPQGGLDDYLRLFHEAGHVEHFAHAPADAPFAFRYLGDYSVTEAYAFLIGKLPSNPAWLREVGGRSAPPEYFALAKLTDLYYVRRYCAKLAYELALHASHRPEEVRPGYTEMLGDALHLRVRPEFYLYDVDDFLYCTCYLRAWMLEAQLRRRVVADFGPHWFLKREAGEYLKALWSLGQELTAPR